MPNRLLFAAAIAAFMLVPTWGQAGYKPAGVGSNLHRRFVIKRTIQQAQRGQTPRRHFGVWVAGGYRETVNNARSRRRR